MGVLSNLEPQNVFHFFEEITKIPHGSGNVRQISDYLVKFARDRGLYCIQDELKNIIIIKEAVPGYEDEPTVILQGHMDMVAVKKPDCDIDMAKEGLRIAVRGDEIYAQGTSLGGDDGIAVAYALALLDSDTIKHPRLEVIVTVDEEVGMDGARGIDLGNLMVGDMLAFITYTMQIVMSFLMLTMISVMLPRAGVAAGRIEEVIGTCPSVTDKEQVQDGKLSDVSGVVSFEDVSFRYPGADEDALQNLTFTAGPGETTAVIGSTGCGKSTLLNLIPRFYDVTAGRITIDGVDIRDLSQHKLRSLLGYVPQKAVLFSGDIASNLKFGGTWQDGASDITDSRMEEAARIAQATEFIESKTEKYHSKISQGGTNVSGGQKQRLSIARAIAKSPKIYLFDDSFSALDYKTDVTLRRALREKTGDATVIIVAQRISTILNADRIIVLDDGKIAGMGTHRELLRECEAYREIARSQLSEAELEGGAAV